MKQFTRFAATLFTGFAFLSASLGYAQEYPRIKDDPKGRVAHEKRMMIDPQTGEIPENIRQKELEYVLSNETLEGRNDKNSSWISRGPYNVGGRTRALAIDASNSSILLAGGVAGGMWRSTDGGTSWVKTTGSSQFHSVTCIAQDTRAGFTNVWYYGTGERAGNSASDGGSFFFGNGIYKSTDGGITWAVLANTTASFTSFIGNFQFNWNVAVNPINGDVYAATGRGIYRSQDGGTNWTIVLDAGNSDGRYTDVAVTAGGVMYATISSVGTPNKGIFRSTDGATWANITPATGYPTAYDRNVIGLAPSNQNVVYFFLNSPAVGKNDHSFFKYTYVSGNGTGAGGAWVNRSVNLPAYGGSVGNLSQGSYNQFVKVKPDNENFVVIGSTNVYRSTDAFATTTNNRWIGGYSPANNVSRYPNHHPDNHSFVFFPATPNTAISGHDGGISKTTDITRVATGNEPVLWTQLNNGYITTQAYSVAIDNNTSGDARIMAGFQDNGKWYNNTTSTTAVWGEEVAGGDGAFTAIVPGASSIRYHGTQNGSLMRSVGTDPANPTDVDGIQPSTATGQLFINPFILDPNNSEIMYYAGGARVWRNNALSTINSGYTFSGTTTGWTNMTGTAITGTISALGVSKAGSANVLYYGTSNGQLYRVDGANAGTGTRVDVYTGKGFPAGYVSSIAVDPTNSANLLVTFSNYNVKSIFHSNNSGTSWTDVGGNLEQFTDGTGNGPSVRWVHVHRTSTGINIYLVGTTTGMYRTETLSGTATVWAQEGASSIGNVVVSMITSRSVDNLVAISTHANGLYSATVTALTAPVCSVPAGLASASITSNSATASWTAVSGAVSYDLQYRVNGGTTWTSIAAITTASRALAGLTASTTYEFQVRTNCSASSSAFSTSATFTTSAAALCAVPAGLASSTITTTGATVSWTAVSGAVSYDLQYRVNGGTTWTSIAAIATTSRALTGLTANTTYEFQVRTNCAGSSSAFSASATFTTSAVVVTYCASKGNSIADEYINRVQIGTINNLSGANAGYGNFTAQSTNVTRGASVSITITPAWTSTAYSEGYGVWVDYNQDGDFLDAGEQVTTQAATTVTPVTKSFTIPATANLGSTRIRVSMKYNAIPTSCEAFPYGEVEDYTLNIVSGVAMNPVDLTLPTEQSNVFEIVSVYPNPTAEQTTTKLVFSVPTKTDVSVVLTNMHGQGVSTETLKAVQGKVEHTLNTQNAKGGIYFINVVTADGQRAVKKLIVK